VRTLQNLSVCGARADVQGAPTGGRRARGVRSGHWTLQRRPWITRSGELRGPTANCVLPGVPSAMRCNGAAAAPLRHAQRNGDYIVCGSLKAHIACKR